MRLVVLIDGEVKTFAMEKTDEAYFQGGNMHPGYRLKAEDDFVIKDGEYLSFSIQMEMYEGAAAAGSYNKSEELAGQTYLRAVQKGEQTEWQKFGWSWALLPENEEESEHLQNHCPRTLFRDMGPGPDEGEAKQETAKVVLAAILPGLVRKFVELNLAEEALDELVHDLVSQQASSINNGGVREQLMYLLGQMSGEEVEKELTRIREEQCE